MGTCCSKMSPDTQHNVDSHRWSLAALPRDAVATSPTARPTTSSGSPFISRDANPLDSASLSPSRGLASVADVVGSSLQGGARSTLRDGILDACLDARSSFSSATFPSDAGNPLCCAQASAPDQRVATPLHAAVDATHIVPLPRFVSYGADSSVQSRNRCCPSHGLIDVSAMFLLPSTSSSSEVSAALRHSMHLCSSQLSSSSLLQTATIH